MDTLKGAETEEKALPKISQLKQPQRHEDWDSTDIHWPLYSLEDAQASTGRLGKICEPSSEGCQRA